MDATPPASSAWVCGEDAHVEAGPGDPERQKLAGACTGPRQRTARRAVRGRGVWRVRSEDLTANIDAAYARTAERIASDQLTDADTAKESQDDQARKHPKLAAAFTLKFRMAVHANVTATRVSGGTERCFPLSSRAEKKPDSVSW